MAFRTISESLATGRKWLNISTVVSLILGILLGSIVTQLLSPQANWESCAAFGLRNSVTPFIISPSAPKSTSSPSFELLNPSKGYVEYQETRVIGTYNASSEFKGPPTPEVDAAWERYWKVWTFGVDAQDFNESKPEYPESAAQLDNGRFLATFEATHQIHCLYNVFRATYLDYYDEERKDFEDNAALWHERVDHCIDVLRQKLECDRDTTLVTYNWVRGKSRPVANFNVARQCLDWEDIDKWAGENKVTAMPHKPEGAVELERIP